MTNMSTMKRMRVMIRRGEPRFAARDPNADVGSNAGSQPVDSTGDIQ